VFDLHFCWIGSRQFWAALSGRNLSKTMLKIRRSANGQVIFTLSGRMDKEHVTALEQLIRSEETGRRIVFDLRDVTLVDHDAIAFLSRCEADLITLMNCPAYIREWITRQQSGS
jgi:hypothetical protein